MSGEQYEKTQLEKYGYEPAFLSKKRSNPEKQLEAALEASPAVDWWIKNGEGQQQFLSIVYGFTDPESGISKQANFYPDFIVKFKDGSIGIYETKSGITITDHHTYGKSDALQNYLKVNANLQVRGGIVNSSGGGLTVFSKPKYNPINTEWDPLVL